MDIEDEPVLCESLEESAKYHVPTCSAVRGESRPGVVCPECAMRCAEINRLRDELRLMMEILIKLKGYDQK